MPKRSGKLGRCHLDSLQKWSHRSREREFPIMQGTQTAQLKGRDFTVKKAHWPARQPGLGQISVCFWNRGKRSKTAGRISVNLSPLKTFQATEVLMLTKLLCMVHFLGREGLTMRGGRRRAARTPHARPPAAARCWAARPTAPCPAGRCMPACGAPAAAAPPARPLPPSPSLPLCYSIPLLTHLPI